MYFNVSAILRRIAEHIPSSRLDWVGPHFLLLQNDGVSLALAVESLFQKAHPLQPGPGHGKAFSKVMALTHSPTTVRTHVHGHDIVTQAAFHDTSKILRIKDILRTETTS